MFLLAERAVRYMAKCLPGRTIIYCNYILLLKTNQMASVKEHVEFTT